jgi:UDP-N-acetylmuramoyl-tripeptide--D-alanyl-D-alanine ligase
VLTFGTAPEAAVRLRDARPGPDGSEVRAALEGHDLEYRIGAPGRHWMINSLAVVACAHALGADPERAAQALARFTAPAGRGARHRIELPGGAMTLIDDAYNANPASMRAALSLLEAAPGRKLAVLGDMLELGAQGAALHQALVGPVAAAGVDLVFTVGPLMGHLHEALPQGQRGAHAETSDQLGPALLAAVRAGDTVLVKGSLGSRMGVLVEALLAAHREVHERRAGGVHVS